jgi:translation initiation factor IF-2
MSIQKRPPIITIMGHVDHGKTTLLDYIRKTNVQGGEAGGITQHIGAYQIVFKGNNITFIDTPGHAAFNKMRQRGAQVTDIVILVVAANDGVKPQTIESIKHIKESQVPYLVAINKVDLPDVRTDKVKAELTEHGVVVQEYGGEIDSVEISAKTGKGVDELLETVLVLAELHEFKADPERPLEAVVIESTKDKRKGVVVSVIVKQGTLKVRQELVVDDLKGRVRALIDERGKQKKKIMPGDPVELLGLSDVPEVGSIIKEKGTEYESEILVEKASTEKMIEKDQGFDINNIDFDAIFSDKEKIRLVIKTDVKGTLEAVLQSLDEESVDLVHAGVGIVTESDLEMAESCEAVIIAFHLKTSNKIKILAKKMRVKIKEYDIIYHLIEDLQKQMLKMLESTIDEVITGKAEILQIFEMNGEKIAGIRVKTGEIKANDLLHLERDGKIIGNPVIKSMKHGKDDVLVVKTKNEAGLTFKNKRLDFKEGDKILAYKKESI